MKKCLLFIAIIISTSAFSQRAEVGIQGIVKSTWLVNENISNEGEEQDYDSGWGFNTGLSFTYYFNKVLGVEVNALIGRHEGSYIGTVGPDDEFPWFPPAEPNVNRLTYNSRTVLSTYDFPLLIKTKSRAGFYFEAGAQYSLYTKARYSIEYMDGDLGQKNVTEHFRDDNISLVTGFGLSRDLSDKFRAMMGFRFDYGMLDIEGVDGFGRSLRAESAPGEAYEKYHRTRSIGGGLKIGIAYKIGDVDDDPDKKKGKIKISNEVEIETKEGDTETKEKIKIKAGDEEGGEEKIKIDIDVDGEKTKEKIKTDPK